MVFPMFQVLGKSDNSNRFWTPCCVLLRNFLHFLPSFCLHISKTMESDIFSFMWKTDKTVRFVRNQQLGSQIILHAKGLSINYVVSVGEVQIVHTSQDSFYKWTKIQSHEIDIFGLKVILKSGLGQFTLNFTKPLQSCCCPVQKNLSRKAELAWQSKYL